MATEPKHALMTKAEYAAHRGVSRPYITKLSKNGVLVMRGGKVDVVASDAVLDDKPVEEVESAPAGQQPVAAGAVAPRPPEGCRSRRRREVRHREGTGEPRRHPVGGRAGWEIWNSLAGVAGFDADLEPVRNFINRQTGVRRIRVAIQKLDGAAAKAATRKAKGTRKAGSRAGTAKEGAPPVRARSKKAIILGMLVKGATITELMAAAGWQGHSGEGIPEHGGKEGDRNRVAGQERQNAKERKCSGEGGARIGPSARTGRPRFDFPRPGGATIPPNRTRGTETRMRRNVSVDRRPGLARAGHWMPRVGLCGTDWQYDATRPAATNVAVLLRAWLPQLPRRPQSASFKWPPIREGMKMKKTFPFLLVVGSHACESSLW